MAAYQRPDDAGVQRTGATGYQDEVDLVATGKATGNGTELEESPRRSVHIEEEAPSVAEANGSAPRKPPDPKFFESQILRSMGDAVIATDAEFNVVFANQSAQDLYDFKIDDVTGISIVDLVETDAGSRDDKIASLRLLVAQGAWDGRVRQLASEGWIHVDSTASVIRDDSGEVVGTVFVSRDVTRSQREETAAHDRAEFASAVLESLPGRTCVIDESGRVIAVNRQYRNEGPAGSGESTGPQIGASYLDWLRELINDQAIADFQELLDGKYPDFRIEFGVVRRRKRRWTELFAVALGTDSRGAVVTHVDITTRKQAENALTRRATHDPLTGLPNRVLLQDRLTQALSRAARTKTQVGLLFCDLDGFREINNTHGHLAGDRLLVTIAKRLRAVCRSSDTVARVSGDEFVIVLEDVEGREEIDEVARRIIEALSEPVELEQGIAKTGTSIGLVISSGVPRAGTRTVENLIRDADSAMYAAKEAGRGRSAWFSPEMLERPRERPTFVQAINRLLNR